LQSIQGVEVTGPVRDVRTYLARAQVSVAPFSIAAGIQNKILEAMSYGLPVVATSRAVQGLTREVAGLVETGNTADELAARVTFLLRDPVAARRIGREGRQRVAAEYSWQHALERLLQLLENPAGADTANAAAHLLSGSLDH
jgi:glycosyltransferase involved in cell wall biosynthesis